MKKLFAIFIILAMICSTTPLVASETPTTPPIYCTPNPTEDCAWQDNYSICNINTQVTVAGGSGASTGNSRPIVKCKWEYDLNVNFLPAECVTCTCNIPSTCLDNGYWKLDACPCINGLQVLPILGGSVKVGYYAVVTDPNGISNIRHVYADVWHPDGEFKYQIELFPLSKTNGIAAFSKVTSCHQTLITYNTNDWTPTWPINAPDKQADVEHELSQDLALVYYGEAYISYCQPAGYYTVGVRAHDSFNEWSYYVYNQFWYIPTTAIKIDFTNVNYGTAIISEWQWAHGDQDMNTNSYPTIQNWGNTPVKLYVWQNDMTFGTTIGQSGLPEYNVEFDARLGSDGDRKYYDPYQNETGHKGIYFGSLGLCTLEKADFSIHVKKADPGNTYNGKMCLIGYREANPVWQTPPSFVKPAPGTVVQDIYDPDPGQNGPGT